MPQDYVKAFMRNIWHVSIACPLFAYTKVAAAALEARVVLLRLLERPSFRRHGRAAFTRLHRAGLHSHTAIGRVPRHER